MPYYTNHLLHLLIFPLLISIAVSNDNRCPGGYYEGTTIDIGSYWYECKNGQVVPKGCLTEDRARIDIQETYDVNSYRMQCVLDSGNHLTVVYKACVQNGREHSVNEQWEENNVWYTCKRNGHGLRVEPVGCMDSGRRVNLEEKVTKDETVYICRKNTQAIPTLTPWGCHGKDGRQYAAGDSFDYDRNWYVCSSQGDRMVSKSVGCLHEQRRLRQGDRFVRDDVVYECLVNSDKTETRPFGCIQRDENNAKVERRLGCFWIEGQPPYQYEMTCKDKDTTATKVATKCVYRVTGGSYTVEPGCYTISDKTAIGCTSDGSDSLRIMIYQVDANGYVNAPGNLRRC